MGDGMSDLPPLTDPDCDLRDFGFLPLDALRLRDSELVTMASGEEFKAAVLLWCAAWHQIPAASIPNNEKLMAKYSGANRRWPKVREMALRGFVLCSDGRYYHRILAEKANEAWTKKKAQRERTRKATEARTATSRQRNDQHNDDRNVHLGTVKGQGQLRERESKHVTSREIQELFDLVRVEVFGPEQARLHGHSLDIVTAERWIEQGATAKTCRAVFEAVQRNCKAAGKQPIFAMSKLDDEIQAAIKAGQKSGDSGGELTPEERAKLPWRYVRAYKRDGIWRGEGSPPGSKDCTVDPAILREFGYEVVP
jgi:hypothetical protein